MDFVSECVLAVRLDCSDFESARDLYTDVGCVVDCGRVMGQVAL